MQCEQRLIDEPLFSICVPQYNRTSFLLYALAQLAGQAFRNFEICISDDCSTDGRDAEVIARLREYHLSFGYRRHAANAGYDRNLRESIALARGRYCLLMGNDDCLASSSVLADLERFIVSVPNVGVAITNYCDFASGQAFIRASRFQNLGAGPDVGVRYFRNATFVSGLILSRKACAEFASDECDGTDFYQTFLMVRIVSSGLPLLNIPVISVKKDVAIAGEEAENGFLNAPVMKPCPITARHHKTLVGFGPVVSHGVRPYVDSDRYNRLMRSAMRQFYFMTYLSWILRWKQMQSFNYAAGIALGTRPSRVIPPHTLSRFSRLTISVYYSTASVIGLLFPKALFFRLVPRLYKFVKRV